MGVTEDIRIILKLKCTYTGVVEAVDQCDGRFAVTGKLFSTFEVRI